MQRGAFAQHTHLFDGVQLGLFGPREMRQRVDRRMHRHGRARSAQAPGNRIQCRRFQTHAGRDSGVARPLEVLREFSRDAVAVATELPLQRLRRAQVQLKAARRRTALVEHAPVQRVAKRVAPADRAVGTRRHARTAQPLGTARQPIAAAPNGVGIKAQHAGQQRVAEFEPDHAGSFQQVAQVAGQPANLPLDAADYGLGKLQSGQHRDRVGPGVGVDVDTERCVAFEVVHHVDQK